MSNPNLILASKSAARRAMFDNVGLIYTAIPANIDERAVESRQDKSPQRLAKELARQKALNIASDHHNALVIGSDSVVALDDAIMHKANSRQEALDKLMSLSGQTHSLISAVAVAKGNVILWDAVDEARLTMRQFDKDFANTYLDKIGDAAFSCVGAYQLEALGPWLFEKIEGDYFTILGLPLVKLLSYLQEYHELEL